MPKHEIDLRKYHKFGFNLLQLMAIIGTIGLVASAIYTYFH